MSKILADREYAIMEPTSDAELLTTWGAGNQESYAVLVARHHGLVRAACARQAASGDADDCAQAVFLVLARRPDAAGRAPSLSAWLQRVATFVCRRARRTALRRRRAESAAAVETNRAAGTRPDEALGHLDECLLRLPEKQRSAVVMHFLAGRSPEEVATALGTSRENAYKLLNRGLAALRALLARRGLAMGSAALASLLAGEAQAATTQATSTTSLAAIVTASHSPTALHLAIGTLTAMKTSLAVSIALVAILSLAATFGLVVLLRAPARATIIVPVQAPAVQQAADVWDPLPADPRLDGRITCNYIDIPVEEIIRTLSGTSGLRMDAAALGTISLQCRDMRVADVLVWTAMLADARITMHEGTICLVPVGTAPAEPPQAASPDDAAIATMLAQSISLDFRDTNGKDLLDFARVVTGQKILAHPRCRLSEQKITLKVENVALKQALTSSVEQFAHCRLVHRNGAVGVLPASPTRASANQP